jgi:hypothetical protein
MRRQSCVSRPSEQACALFITGSADAGQLKTAALAREANRFEALKSISRPLAPVAPNLLAPAVEIKMFLRRGAAFLFAAHWPHLTSCYEAGGGRVPVSPEKTLKPPIGAGMPTRSRGWACQEAFGRAFPAGTPPPAPAPRFCTSTCPARAPSLSPGREAAQRSETPPC